MTRTPLRISLFGGGTDYPEYFERHSGAVLASAIDKYSYITASPFPSRLFDYSIRVSYRKVELVKSREEIEHQVYRECLRHCGIDRDIELHNVADLPSFSGLGSSSTFTVGLLHALHAFKDETVTPMDLAYEAIRIERDALKENVGCQDQTLAAIGGLSMIEFRKTDDIRVFPLMLSAARIAELEAHLLLVFTRITRRASDIAQHQLRRIGSNLDTLHVMRRMVDRGAQILTGEGDMTEIGRLLHEAWTAKRTLADTVSNDEIDRLYELARANGAIGGKLLGAGGGGFLLLFAAPEDRGRLARAFEAFETVEVKLNAPGSQVIL